MSGHAPVPTRRRPGTPPQRCRQTRTRPPCPTALVHTRPRSGCCQCTGALVGRRWALVDAPACPSACLNVAPSSSACGAAQKVLTAPRLCWMMYSSPGPMTWAPWTGRTRQRAPVSARRQQLCKGAVDTHHAAAGARLQGVLYAVHDGEAVCGALSARPAGQRDSEVPALKELARLAVKVVAAVRRRARVHPVSAPGDTRDTAAGAATVPPGRGHMPRRWLQQRPHGGNQLACQCQRGAPLPGSSQQPSGREHTLGLGWNAACRGEQRGVCRCVRVAWTSGASLSTHTRRPQAAFPAHPCPPPLWVPHART